MRACVCSAVLCVLVASCVAVDGAPPDLEKATPAESLEVPPEILQPPSIPQTPNQQDKHTLCQRRPLTVKFSDLGWQDWILAPEAFEDGYCSGLCPLPHLPNTTNHAIVQAYAGNQDNTLPSPCCVPTEYEPLAVLYRSEYNNIILRNYKNMKVKSCGCR